MVVTTIAVLAGGLSEASIVRIAGEVDANWRGAYDILVRPSGARLDLEASEGVVEPNFLAFAGEGGIGGDQLDSIRAMSNVELAAPVAFVGYVRTVITAPAIAIPDPPASPGLYRIVVQATSSDGLSERLITRQTALALIGPLEQPNDVERWATTYGDTGAAEFADGSITGELLSREQLPAIASPVLAVDPQAEMELLGRSATFLQPLIAARETAGGTVGTFDRDRIPEQFEWARSQIRELDAVSDRTRSRPIVPIVVSDSLFARLSLSLEVTQLGASIEGYPSGDDQGKRLEAARLAAGPGERLIGRDVIDVSATLRPFEGGRLGLTWPGTTASEPPAQLFSQFGEFQARLAGRPRYSIATPRAGSKAVSLQIEPVGIVGPDQNPPVPISPDADFGEIVEGREMAYRSLTAVDLPVAAGFEPEPGTSDYPFVFAPLGEFDLASLELPDNLVNYVPLGAYDPPVTTLVADPLGRLVDAREIVPTLNPAGLIAVPPLAITDIEGATLLRGSRAIDAVRVRVRGLSDFSGDARQRVESVATQIAALGLDVDIVAGSSPQLVEVFVPAYDADVEPPADLGWVQQGWTTLGAAERVERSLEQVSVALLVLALIAGFVIPVASVAGTLSRRVREAAILISQGWSPTLARRWYIEEAVVGGMIVAVAGMAAWAGVGRSLVALAATVVMAVGFVIITTVGAWLVVRRASVGPGGASAAGDLWLSVPRGGGLAVDGLTSYALRSLLARPVRTVVTVAASAIGTVALTLGALLILALAQLAGPTLLAGYVSDAVRLQQLAILVSIAFGCLAFSLLLTRHEVRETRGELVSLAAAGWTNRQRRTLFLRGQAIAMLPTLLIASIACALLGPFVASSSGLLAALLAVPVTVVVGALGVSVARPPELVVDT